MSVCMYVFMYVCMYVPMFKKCVCVCVFKRGMYVCMCLCMCVCMYLCSRSVCERGVSSFMSCAKFQMKSQYGGEVISCFSVSVITHVSRQCRLCQRTVCVCVCVCVCFCVLFYSHPNTCGVTFTF